MAFSAFKFKIAFRTLMKILAYNADWLDKNSILETVETWHKKGWLTDAQQQAAQAQNAVNFYSPNVFVRIGLAFFTYIAIMGVLSVISIAAFAAFEDNFQAWGILLLVVGGGLLGLLELMVLNRHYRSGIDDMLLYIGVGFLIGGLCMLITPSRVFDYSPEANTMNWWLTYAILALAVFAVGAIRYTDRLLTVHACFAALTLVALAYVKIARAIMGGEDASFQTALLGLPFLGMLFAAATYYFVRKYKPQHRLRYWTGCFQVLEVLSLGIFYLCGNYFVVQSLYVSLMYNGLAEESASLPMGWLFWLVTAMTPLAYLYFGLKNKDRLLLWMGLIVVAAAVFTFKYYFSLGHHEVTVTLAGAILVALAWFSIRFLKKGHPQFTYEDDSESKPALLNAEALVVAQSFGTPQTVPDQSLQFGGGDFGGGGAGGNY